jgi:hypothetical protein
VIVPIGVQEWTGTDPVYGAFRLVGGDTIPPQLEAAVPDAWRADQSKQSKSGGGS